MNGSTPSMAESAKAAAGPWVVSRFLALAAVALGRFLVAHFGLHGSAASASHAGLLGWDAGWYRQIAAHGYSAGTGGPVRFYPLYPLIARALSVIPGIGVGAALLVISNVAAFVAFALLYALAADELDDERSAQLAVWLVAVAPAGFVLVMGYAEALMLVLTLLAFLALRRGAFGWAIPAALLAGACRPVGILLAAPALVEVLRARGYLWSSMRERRSRMSGRGARTVAVQVGSIVAAPIGACAYFGWVTATGRGSFLAPLRQQLSRTRRGGITDPVSTFVQDLKDAVHGQHLGTALHAPWAIVFLLLGVVVALRLPASYAVYAWLTLAVIVTAPNLASIERYAMLCFPLAMGAATLLKGRQVTWALLGCLGAAVLAYGTLAFVGAYVP